MSCFFERYQSLVNWMIFGQLHLALQDRALGTMRAVKRIESPGQQREEK